MVLGSRPEIFASMWICRFERLETPLGHLVRRNALRKEITARLDQVSWGSPVDRILKQFLQSLVVKRDQFQEAFAFRNRAAAKFVGSAQHRFASPRCVFTQGSG